MAASADDSEGGGEGYFASISDLMVGVLFVFLLMLTVFALNFRSAEDDTQDLRARLEAALREAEQRRAESVRLGEELKLALSRARNAEWEASRRAAEAAAALEEADKQRLENARLESLLAAQRSALLEALDLLERELQARTQARDRMLGELKQRLQERGVVVEIDVRSGVLRLAERNLRFPTRSADLGREAVATVSMIAEVFAQVLPCFAAGAKVADCGDADAAILEAVLVEGHTDLRPIVGSQRFRDNYDLAAARALTVYRALLASQPALKELRNPESQPLLAVSGYGETRPLSGTERGTEEDHARNRRIDVRFVLSSRTADEVQRLKDEISRVLRALG